MNVWGWAMAGVGATAAAGGGYIAAMVAAGATGLPNLDSRRTRVALELARHGLFGATHMRAMMAILKNEQSNGAKPNQDIAIPPLTGDTDARVGPSIGAGEVSRALAIRLGLWPLRDGMSFQDQLDSDDDRAAYQAFGEDPANDGTLVGWAVTAYAKTLRGYVDAATGENHAGTDGDIWGENGAVRLYNGPGPDALTYLSNAIAFAQSRWPSEATG